MIFTDSKQQSCRRPVSLLAAICCRSRIGHLYSALLPNWLLAWHRHFSMWLLYGGLLFSLAFAVMAESPSEYRLKVAFLYNFASFTEWPELQGQAINLCILGDDPFRENLQHIRHKNIHDRDLSILYVQKNDDLSMCQIVFISRSDSANIANIIKLLDGRPILTIADIPGAGQQGVVLNMAVKDGKVVFEANLIIARRKGLKLSSQLLRFATEVYQ